MINGFLHQEQLNWWELFGSGLDVTEDNPEENLFEAAEDLSLGWRFAFQQINQPKHTAML